MWLVPIFQYQKQLILIQYLLREWIVSILGENIKLFSFYPTNIGDSTVGQALRKIFDAVKVHKTVALK